MSANKAESLDTDPYESGFEENAAEKEVPSCELPMSLPPSTHCDLTAIVPQSYPLAQGELSLIPDILMGWRPKFDKAGPVPLNFNLQQLPSARHSVRGTDLPCVFHGFRPRDTIVLHRTLRGKCEYPPPYTNSAVQEALEFLSMRDQISKDPRPFVGMRAGLDPVQFEATFESGNLDQVYKVSDTEFDLYMRADSNTLGHHQWYYFSASAPNGSIRFNILNFTKRDSLYEQGMLPLVYEEHRKDLGWHRAGTNVRYCYSKLNQWMTARRAYFSLSFEYEFTGGPVHFAYSIPYTYSRLLRLLEELEPKATRSLLCKSLSGLEVPLLTITDSAATGLKEHIIMSARVHPGETHGSWMMEGFLRFITGNNSAAVTLRKRLVFHIVPMLNPDGVVLGNYRSCLSGSDLNRQFQYPDSKLHPTVSHLKSLIAQITRENRVLAFIDMHAHSKKKSVFMYGPHYPLHSERYYTMRVIPKLMSERTDMFRYYSCKFRNDKGKEKAARLVVSKEFGLANSYTLEASFHGYLNTERGTNSFDAANLLAVGRALAEVLHEFLSLRDEEELQKEAKRIDRLKKKNRRRSEGGDFEPGKVPEAPRRTMADLIQIIKDEEVREEESDSGGSDSSAEEDELDPETQKKLTAQILEAMDNLGGKEEKKAKSRGNQREEEGGRPRTASTLAKFFSKARTDGPRRRKPESEAPKSDSKVLRNELIRDSPTRPKSQRSGTPHPWRHRERLLPTHRINSVISQPPTTRSPLEEPELSLPQHKLTERRHSFSFDSYQTPEKPTKIRLPRTNKRDNSTQRPNKQCSYTDAQKQWASFLVVQPVPASNRTVLSKKSRSKLYHLEKSSARTPQVLADDMLRRYAVLPRTKIK